MSSEGYNHSKVWGWSDVLMFLKEVSHGHQCSIYFNKKKSNCEYSAAITQVLSGTWPFRNHPNMPFCATKNI